MSPSARHQYSRNASRPRINAVAVRQQLRGDRRREHDVRREVGKQGIEVVRVRVALPSCREVGRLALIHGATMDAPG
jgi:hypothetical protein